jgi:dihydroorotase
MGVYANAITHAKYEYKKINKKDPLFLMMTDENLKLLLHEAFNDNKMKIDSVYDSTSRKQVKRFINLEIVIVRITYQGSFGWALGD